MILRILVLFSSPLSSWQIPLCRPNGYPTFNAMTHGPFVTIKWYTLGASDIKWPVSSSRQWCPTLWEYHPSLCASHPARKFQGYLGNFHELHWKLKKIAQVSLKSSSRVAWPIPVLHIIWLGWKRLRFRWQHPESTGKLDAVTLSHGFPKGHLRRPVVPKCSKVILQTSHQSCHFPPPRRSPRSPWQQLQLGRLLLGLKLQRWANLSGK